MRRDGGRGRGAGPPLSSGASGGGAGTGTGAGTGVSRQMRASLPVRKPKAREKGDKEQVSTLRRFAKRCVSAFETPCSFHHCCPLIDSSGSVKASTREEVDKAGEETTLEAANPPLSAERIAQLSAFSKVRRILLRQIAVEVVG